VPTWPMEMSKLLPERSRRIFSIIGPLSAALIVGCVCLLVVALVRARYDPERRLVADTYVEAVARATCGPMHQNDECVAQLVGGCRDAYGALCPTRLLMGGPSMKDLLPTGRTVEEY
jgi:hypothetical protein